MSVHNETIAGSALRRRRLLRLEWRAPDPCFPEKHLCIRIRKSAVIPSGAARRAQSRDLVLLEVQQERSLRCAALCAVPVGMTEFSCHMRLPCRVPGGLVAHAMPDATLTGDARSTVCVTRKRLKSNANDAVTQMTQVFRPILECPDALTAATARRRCDRKRPQEARTANPLIAKNIDRTDRTDRKNRGSFYIFGGSVARGHSSCSSR